MVYLIKRMLQILRKDGLLPLLKKTTNRIYALQKYRKINLNDERKRWETLKDKYKGKRVFLLGNGPSLNKTPLYLLKDEYKMCFNHFSIMLERLNWHPDFFLTSDNLVLSDLVKDFEKIIPPTKHSFFPGLHFRGNNFIKEIKKYNNAYWTLHLHGRGFSHDLPRIYPGGSVIYEGFQILKYLGFSEVYLLGVDMNYKIHKSANKLEAKGIDIESQHNDDPNHFDPRYFGKGKKYHQPEKYVIDNAIRDLKYVSDKVTNKDFRIINLGFDSKLEVFPREIFSSVMDQSESLQKDIFSKHLMTLSESNCDTGMEITDFMFLTKMNSWNSQIDSFSCHLDIALNLIDKAIFTYIPIGPFDNKYYFLKRKKSLV